MNYSKHIKSGLMVEEKKDKKDSVLCHMQSSICMETSVASRENMHLFFPGRPILIYIYSDNSPGAEFPECFTPDKETSVYMCAQSCPTLCKPMNCSPPGSSVHGILQAKYWRGLPFPPPVDLPDPSIKPCLLHLLGWQADSLPLSHLGRQPMNCGMPRFLVLHYFLVFVQTPVH